ncbi:organic cation transporter protein-like isoform X2 [Centruroides vittatus]|uniref:organic cation transporter protein-like isoform X2 n=1 Tax=Centruroides vittatus TaxID=120091 RepID=UPI00350FCAB3
MNHLANNSYSENGSEEQNSDLNDLVGNFGKWHVIIMSIAAYVSLPGACYNMSMAFLAPNVDYWCENSFEYFNLTTEKWKNHSIPIETLDNVDISSTCKMYGLSIEKNISQIACTSLYYDHTFYRSTIIEEWDLVCERAWLASLAQSLYYFGFLITGLLGGQLSDRYGRKPIFYISVAWTFLFGMISAFSQNFWMFAVCRFFLAMGRSTTFLTIYTLVIETVSKEYRVNVRLVCFASWILGQMFLVALVWLFRHWFYIELIPALCYSIILPLWRIIPESPRWLLSRGRIDEAEEILERAVKLNNRKIENLSYKLKMISERIIKESKGKDNKQVTFLDILKYPNLRRLTLILFIVWIANVLSYYGLSFSADDIGVDSLLFFFLAALVEIPACVLYFCFQHHIGRKLMLIIPMVITGLICLIAISVPKDFSIILIVLSVISKFSMSISLITIYLLPAEIYPTVVRNVGLGSCSMMGRLGAIAAPFMKEAAIHVHRVFPLALFGIISIFGALLVLLLPETKDLKLSDTLAQGEHIGRCTTYVLVKKSENEEAVEDNSTENKLI